MPENQKYRNQILNSLSGPDLALIEPMLVPLELPVRKMLERRGQKIEHVYFPESGMASVVAKVAGANVEIGIIGRESMTGLTWLLGQDTPNNECFMQMPGQGHRLPVAVLADAIEQSDGMRAALLKAARLFLNQVSSTAVANALASLTARGARWLLMCHDRSDTDRVEITHEFLGMMLGARRPAVTIAIQKLEGEGAIKASRGEILIRDREGLISLAAGSY